VPECGHGGGAACPLSPACGCRVPRATPEWRLVARGLSTTSDRLFPSFERDASGRDARRGAFR
jgi:hypothetical protein